MSLKYSQKEMLNQNNCVGHWFMYGWFPMKYPTLLMILVILTSTQKHQRFFHFSNINPETYIVLAESFASVNLANYFLLFAPRGEYSEKNNSNCLSFVQKCANINFVANEVAGELQISPRFSPLLTH